MSVSFGHGRNATPSSTTVRAASTKKIPMYGGCLTAGSVLPGTGGCGTSAMSSSRLDEVDDGEEDDPDEVDEVPVQADDLHTTMVGAGVLPAEGLPCHEHHAQDAHR